MAYKDTGKFSSFSIGDEYTRPLRDPQMKI
jgi:hypothetical protein